MSNRPSPDARTKPGSNGRAAAKLKLQKLHARIAAKRRHVAYQITTGLVVSCRRLDVEDLNVADMGRLRTLARGTLARALADAGLGDLARLFEYKAGWYGTELVVADRWFASSKTCSGCGHVKKTLLLSERTPSTACGGEKCGFEADRDLNAAINLACWPDRQAEPTQDLPSATAA